MSLITDKIAEINKEIGAGKITYKEGFEQISKFQREYYKRAEGDVVKNRRLKGANNGNTKKS